MFIFLPPLSSLNHIFFVAPSNHCGFFVTLKAVISPQFLLELNISSICTDSFHLIIVIFSFHQKIFLDIFI